MLLINPSNEYPRFIGDLQIEYPDYNWGDPLPEGWIMVEETLPPTVGEDEVWEETFPVKTKDSYKQAFRVRAMTSEEIERRDAPKTAKAKLAALGLTQIEIEALGLDR